MDSGAMPAEKRQPSPGVVRQAQDKRKTNGEAHFGGGLLTLAASPVTCAGSFSSIFFRRCGA